jgi:hypothetical protein
MESDLFMEESLDMPVCAIIATEQASSNIAIRYVLIFIVLLFFALL